MAFAFSVTSKDNLTSSMDPNEDEEWIKDYFPYDSDVTDFTLIVEGKTLHVARVVLIDASPVFRKMLTGDFKEREMSELELPGKECSKFVPFLRCIFPREELKLTETCIDDILPLADEYEVKCVLQKCENWLLSELELKNGKVTAQHASVKSNIKFLMKCLYYGEKYVLEQLYKKSFKLALPYRLKWYKKNEHYQMLLEENKRKLLEARLREIEKNVKKIHKGEENRFDDMLNDFDFRSTSSSGPDSDPELFSETLTGKTYKCSSDLFQ
uniref:BTB domain-containing protein n=2 Tax=Magallana gigas TaxID=29159 RepID=A0A8W8LQZ9_MAGGI|nr:BTB and MATH domain-containing protein 38 [Crassostrea gigas]